MNAYSWTYDYIDENITLPTYNMILRGWITQPPQYLLIKSFLGFNAEESKAANAPKQTSQNNESVQNSVDAFKSVFGARQSNPIVDSFLKQLESGDEFQRKVEEKKKNLIRERYKQKQ